MRICDGDFESIASLGEFMTIISTVDYTPKTLTKIFPHEWSLDEIICFFLKNLIAFWYMLVEFIPSLMVALSA